MTERRDMSTLYTGVLRLKLKEGKKMQRINLTPSFEDLKTLVLVKNSAADYPAIWRNVGFGFKE